MSYDPNEPRDFRGRWSADGGGGTAGGEVHRAEGFPFVTVTDPTNADHAKKIAEKAESVARALEFTPTKMIVTDAPHKFTINGQEYTEGGHYDPQSEYITLRHALNPDTGDGVIAHEIAHAKYDALIKDYGAERAAMEKDPDYHGHGFMKPDGSLNEPYASRYPLYTRYNEVAGGTRKGTEIQDFAKSDGVSKYSKDYWEAWQNSEVGTGSAMHETLAEMARVKWEGHRDATAHKDNVKYIKAHGGQWTADDEKKWKQDFAEKQRNAYTSYRLGSGDVNGRKVYFATATKTRRKNWEDLYDLMDSNWKRRNTK